MKREENLTVKMLINEFTDKGYTDNVGELNRGFRYGRGQIDMKKYLILMALLLAHNEKHGTNYKMKDHAWAIYCIELKAFCPDLGMFTHSSNPDYKRATEAIKIAILTGNAAEGEEGDPQLGLHFKSACNVSNVTLRKAKVLKAKPIKDNSKSKNKSKAKDKETTSPIPCFCKDCKVLEALLYANRTIEKLVK